ncbi:unnamed protein product [Oikopleura dioica]|uniref:Uncharacterized protein n=1 Tax=Oikopleura dioica TaxID=34765 RepID=E4Y8I1_OIKDI|nr:unnamed protein product [Oikopleura dioica]
MAVMAKKNTDSSTRRREYMNERDLQLNKLFVVYAVLVHVCKMVQDRKFRAPIWAQLAVSSQKAWFEAYIREAELNNHDSAFSPRCIAALGSIYAHSLRQMTELLNIYDRWTHNSLENAYQYELDEEQSANLLEFWCDTRPSGRQRRELIKKSMRTENPPAALGHFFQDWRG